MVGVNVTNPHQRSVEELRRILDELQASGVRVIRSPLVDQTSVDFIRDAYARGIRTIAIVPIQHREGAPVRPAAPGFPEMWPGPALSDADPVRLRSVIEPQLEALERDGVVLAALELGNEINWAAFNGEFPVPGAGRVLGLRELEEDPLGRRVAAGYRAYVASAHELRRIRDESRLNRHTPIVSAGLADPQPDPSASVKKVDGVSVEATLAYLAAHGLDAAVDAYGVHVGLDPASQVSAAARLQALERGPLSRCRSPADGKPCWITEWALPNADKTCPIDDRARAAAVSRTLEAFSSFVRQGRLGGYIWYDWGSDPYASVFRCGSLTASGRLALSASAVRP